MKRYFYDKYKVNTSWGSEQKGPYSDTFEIDGTGRTFYRLVTYSEESGYSLIYPTNAAGLTSGTKYYTSVSNGNKKRSASGIFVVRSPYLYQFSGRYFDDWRNLINTRGSYLSQIIAQDGIYPDNGVHSDGFWYVKKGEVPITKHLFQDGTQIQRWNQKWESVGVLPLTKETLVLQGMDNIDIITEPQSILLLPIQENQNIGNGRNYGVQVNKNKQIIKTAKIKL